MEQEKLPGELREVRQRGAAGSGGRPPSALLGSSPTRHHLSDNLSHNTQAKALDSAS